MNKYLINLFFVGILFNPILVSALRADSLPDRSFLIRPWAVGQTVTLQTEIFENGTLTNTFKFTYSIVGSEIIGGKPYFWLERELNKQDGSGYIEKLQVRQPGVIGFDNTLGANPTVLTARRRLKETIFPGVVTPPIPAEIPVSPDSVNQFDNEPAPSENEDFGKRYVPLSQENVTVPAGTFNGIKFNRDMGTINPPGYGGAVTQFLEAWGSPKIPIWGLVQKNLQRWNANLGKVELQQTVLLSYSETSAVSKIKVIPTPEILPSTTPTPGVKRIRKHAHPTVVPKP